MPLFWVIPLIELSHFSLASLGKFLLACPAKLADHAQITKNLGSSPC